MIHELVDLLDRSWAALRDESDIDFAFACFSFLNQLQSDIRISALLSDCRREETASWAALEQEEHATRAALGQLMDELERLKPSPFPEPPGVDNVLDYSAPALRQWLMLPAPVEDEDDAPWTAGYEDKADSRLDGVLVALGKMKLAPELQDRIQQTRTAWDHARRVRRLFYRVSAGAALARIDRDLRDLHPPKVGETARAAQFRRMRTRDGGLASLLDAMFGDRRRIHRIDESHETALAEHVRRMRTDMRRVYEEVRRRLGAERSLRAVFDRYRQRCQWYDPDALEQIATRGRGHPEDRLLETLVTFLFDHGLNPLTRPMAGRLQPDILGVDGRFSFYVEAKQYTGPCRTYLRRGIQQIWDMLNQLAGTAFDIHEAFCVVYRRGGPAYKFPPSIQAHNLMLHFIMIDLSPSAQRGSRAPQHYEFTEAELRPLPAEWTERRRPLAR